jgi:hypothetical protein
MLCQLQTDVCTLKKLLEKLVNNYGSLVHQESRSDYMVDIEGIFFDNRKILIPCSKMDLIPKVEESESDLIWDLSRYWRSL